MKHFSLILAVFFCVAGSCFAAHRATNGPYIQSISGKGVFYARCIPAGKEGNKGTTTIYRVGIETDEKVDTYDWYSPEGVVLGWSPIAGKVAVMSLREGNESKDEQVEFSFYLGGRHLRSYTAKELKDMGVQSLPTSGGTRMSYTVLGVEQMPPGTNKYVFVVEINKSLNQGDKMGSKLFFDILTGESRN